MTSSVPTNEAIASTLQLASSFIKVSEAEEPMVLLYDTLCCLRFYLESDNLQAQRRHLVMAKEIIGELYHKLDYELGAE